MKKIYVIALLCVVCLMLCGCSESKPISENISSDISSENIVNSDKVDVDLTTLNSTMVYSQVYDIVSNPDNYLGKTIKMKGNVGVYHDTKTDMYYYACIIPDATACCQQGIEFLLKGELDYDNYPKEGTEITIEGSFETYKEGEYTYPRLKNAELL